MKYYKKLFFLLLSLLFACQNKHQAISPSHNAYTLKIVDSIKMTGTNLSFDDHRQAKVLMHNPVSNAIYVYDMNKKTTQKFNNSGSNYDNYPILFGNLSFFNDSTIAVGIFRHINLYNLKGKFIKNIKVKRLRKTYAPIQNITPVTDSTFVFLESIQGNTADPNLYKKTVKTAVYNNFLTQKQLAFADFPEKESDYNNKEYYYVDPGSSTYRKQGNRLFSLGFNDAHIYQYNIKTGQKEKVYGLHPKYYHPYKNKFGKGSEASIQQAILHVLQNSEMYNFSIKDSLFFIAYNKAFEKKDITIDMLSLKDMPDKVNCLQVVDKKGKVLFDDQTKNLGKFMFEDNNFLYFQAPTNEKAEEENYTKIYKAKLVKNDE